MKFDTFTLALLLFSSTPSLAIPPPVRDLQLFSRDAVAALDPRNIDVTTLFKRKGGGGGGGRGGSGSSSSGSSSSGSRGGSSSPGSSSSSRGGATKQGSGPTRGFGGGKYYGGGATTPYSAGSRSPLGIAPLFLGVAALSIFPGLWLAGAYNYPYNHPYSFRNRTATNSSSSTTTALVTRQTSEGVDQTKPVLCLCAQYQECGCDDNNNSTFLDELIGDGTYSELNKTLVTVSDVNRTSTIVLNGTLPNGTTSSGGTEDANAAPRMLLQASGYWLMVVLVGCTVWLV